MPCHLRPRISCSEAPLGPSLADACSESMLLGFLSLLNMLVRKNEKISGLCERVKPVNTPDDKYDFVVIGGGAAGSAVAARLSEIHDWKVLLMEAGVDEPAGAQIPDAATMFLQTNMIWNYTTTNETHACLSTNGSCAWTSGMNLGGNTPHNGMIYLRGNPTDYNNWGEKGNEKWTWEDVEPFFIKGEDNGEIERVGRKHHGTGGPLSVERFPYIPPFGDAILKASEEVGYGISDDLNGDQITGFSRTQSTNKKGVRRSSARAYLWPIRNRGNLHVTLESHATRLIIKNKKAIGVEYLKNGELRTVYVDKEVILSGSIVESPHILLLSGIGPEEHLESMDIGVVLNLPGVGENLHDHPAAILPATITDIDTIDTKEKAAMEYLGYQNGPLSTVGSSAVVGLFASNATAPDYPDIELNIVSYGPLCGMDGVGDLTTMDQRVVFCTSSYLHPKSRGRVTLKSKDPLEYPIITANYLADDNDVQGVVEGMRMIIKMADTEALRAYNFTLVAVEACSEYGFNTEEYLVCVARQANYPLYHQAGTCKMGPSSDPMAVVDPRLRVHGIKRLRVADNSIMPEVISGNTQAVAMMIGERAADFIKEDWGRKYD